MADKDIKSIRASLEALKEEAKDYRDIMQDNETFMDMIMKKRSENTKQEVAQIKSANREKAREILNIF